MIKYERIKYSHIVAAENVPEHDFKKRMGTLVEDLMPPSPKN